MEPTYALVFVRICLSSLFLLSSTSGTIDMTKEQFEYIASQLTETECRRLIASLHFSSYELPPTVLLTIAEKNVPELPCINLLLKWNSGDEKWEGGGKTHAEVQRRLRQVGKTSLADWLGISVFHQLARDINDTLLNKEQFEDTVETYSLKLFKETEPPEQVIPWVVFDFVLWITFLGLLLTLLVLYFRIIYLTSKTRPRTREREEMRSLFGNDVLIAVQEKDNEDSLLS